MTRRGWLLFSAMSVIWGIPYLLIKVAVDDVSPAVVVAARTGIAALVLVPLAIHRGALRPAFAHFWPLLAFTVIEMAGPWILLADAERKLSSSLAGLLIAAVPLVAAVVAVGTGDRSVLAPSRLVGLAIGVVGVALVVGFGRDGAGDWWSVTEVMLTAIGYAVAPFIASRWLSDVPILGVVAAALGMVAVAYVPIALIDPPDDLPPADAIWALVGLAIICTGLAFMVFFALIAEVGPNRATLITFVNPAVALALGIVLLDEKLTAGLLAGFPLVIAGCWLAARPERSREHPAATAHA